MALKQFIGPSELGSSEQSSQKANLETSDTPSSCKERQLAAAGSDSSVSWYFKKTKRIPVETLKCGKKQQAIWTL
jgi:hypothetical protein